MKKVVVLVSAIMLFAGLTFAQTQTKETTKPVEKKETAKPAEKKETTKAVKPDKPADKPTEKKAPEKK
jgi:hypothetical protein